MNRTYFYPKIRGNLVNKKNSAVNLRFVVKTSDIINVSENIRSVAVLTFSKAHSSTQDFGDSAEIVSRDLESEVMSSHTASCKSPSVLASANQTSEGYSNCHWFNAFTMPSLSAQRRAHAWKTALLVQLPKQAVTSDF